MARSTATDPHRSSSEAGEGTAYDVGYGRPPVSTRFRPGTSGNPKGRPKQAKNLSTLTREKLAAKVPVREGGRERRMSKGEIGVTKLVNRFAETGDPKLFMALVRLLESAGAGEASHLATKIPDASDEGVGADEAILAWFIEQNRSAGGGES